MEANNNFPDHCLYCGGGLVWQNDFMRSETGLSEEDCEPEQDGLVQMFSCSNCGRFYEISEPPEEEKKNYPAWGIEDGKEENKQ